MTVPAADQFAFRIGYCTNVHAGRTVEDVKRDLDQYAVGVRDRLRGDARTAAWTKPMDVGLWLAVDAARRLRTETGALESFRDFLVERELRAFTFNGFPYDEFHRRVVKHAVYRPGWDDPQRLAYTRDLIDLMAGLHEPGSDAGISTVPIGWRPWFDDASLVRAAANLRLIARHAADVERRTGVTVHVDLEPEPGCVLDRPRDVVRFFEGWLLPGLSAREEVEVRRFIRTCHDTCHAAVMFDGQASSLDELASAGIGVGKIQVSSAIDVDFTVMTPETRAEAIERLASFAEPRYLHQVCVRTRRDGPIRFEEDLPALVADVRAAGDGGIDRLAGEHWRVHFHVPVDADRIGPLGTTASSIDACLEAAKRHGIRDLEVETYAWTVLPPDMQPECLADGIASEVAWVINRPSVEDVARAERMSSPAPEVRRPSASEEPSGRGVPMPAEPVEIRVAADADADTDSGADRADGASIDRSTGEDPSIESAGPAPRESPGVRPGSGPSDG